MVAAVREMPLHRVCSAIFICESEKYFREAYRYEKLYDPENQVISRVGLQGDAMTVRVCMENDMIDEDIKTVRQALADDGELLGERFSTLARLLKDLGYNG
jgi:hypothetical protein